MRPFAIALSSYRDLVAKRVTREKHSVRAKLGAEAGDRACFRQELRGVWARKLWRPMRREDFAAARCTGERLMAKLGLHGVIRGKLSICQHLLPEDLAEVSIEPSSGSGGDSYDNALAETTNGLYKAEIIKRRGPWRSFEAVEFATLTWVDWFNNRRLQEPGRSSSRWRSRCQSR